MFPEYQQLGRLLRFLAILPAFFVLSSGLLQADSEQSVITSVELGIGGVYKYGKWVPVTVKIDSGKLGSAKDALIQLKLSASDSNGYRAIYPGSALSTDSADELILTGWFQTGRTDDLLELTIEEVESNKILETMYLSLGPSTKKNLPVVKPLRQSDFVVAGVGEPAGFKELGESEQEESRSVFEQLYKTEYVSVEDFNQIPESIKSLDGIDALVLAGNYNLSEKQNEILNQWVKSGGHLVIAVAKEIDKFKDSGLSQWIPFKANEVVSLRELTELEIFSGKRRPVVFNRQISAADFEAGDSKVFVESKTGPLIAQAGHGFGKVTFIGLDIHKSPFLRWSPMKSVALKVLFGTEKKKDESGDSGQRLSHLGMSDLATQLRNYMEEFSDIKRLSNWSVMGIVLVYLLIIGPLDYLIVHKVLKKPQWTWITLPLFIALAGIVSVSNARAMNGNQLNIHTVDIFDLDVGQNYSRKLSYADLYSPETRRYEIGYETELPKQNSPSDKKNDSTLIWSGSPEEGVGGIYRLASEVSGRPSYDMGKDFEQIENLPMQIWSTTNLQIMQTDSNADYVENHLEASEYGRLKGNFKHSFDTPLKDWLLFYKENIYFPDKDLTESGLQEISPGVLFDVSQKGINQENLKKYLTKSRIVITKNKDHIGEDVRSEQTSYDVLSKNPYDIIKAITLYQRVGGEEYYRLRNDVLRSYDFSDALELNRAILIGRIDKPVTKIKLNGEVRDADRHDSFVRIVFPVKRIQQEKKEQIKIEIPADIDLDLLDIPSDTETKEESVPDAN